MTRLDFMLPAFTRALWVNELARATWEPRFADVAHRWRQIEWQTVVEGVRPCALVYVSHSELAVLVPRIERQRLRAVPVASSVGPGSPLNSSGLVHRVAIGRRRDVSGFRKAWTRGDDDAIGRWLGYPACCREFFRTAVVKDGWMDPTWPRALDASRCDGDALRLDVVLAPQLNLFWESLGVRLVPHIPCSSRCAAAMKLADAFSESGLNAGFQSALDVAHEVLRWPVEWSALHGIAEIKTPLVKISTRTVATADKLVIRYRGERYPAGGVRGVRFPYVVPGGPAARRYLDVVDSQHDGCTPVADA